jgi:hypothetical protein
MCDNQRIRTVVEIDKRLLQSPMDNKSSLWFSFIVYLNSIEVVMRCCFDLYFMNVSVRDVPINDGQTNRTSTVLCLTFGVQFISKVILYLIQVINFYLLSKQMKTKKAIIQNIASPIFFKAFMTFSFRVSSQRAPYLSFTNFIFLYLNVNTYRLICSLCCDSAIVVCHRQ